MNEISLLDMTYKKLPVMEGEIERSLTISDIDAGTEDAVRTVYFRIRLEDYGTFQGIDDVSRAMYDVWGVEAKYSLLERMLDDIIRKIKERLTQDSIPFSDNND